jgi:2-hydroxy-6-oxonona-2,4-dienedioate hydrolase
MLWKASFDSAEMKSSTLKSVWTRVGELRMHALAAAHPPESAAAVVLVHGIVISSRYMVPTADRLAQLCRVYAVDLPGYGLRRGDE